MNEITQAITAGDPYGAKNTSLQNSFDQAEIKLIRRFGKKSWDDQNEAVRLILIDTSAILERMKEEEERQLHRHLISSQETYTWINQQLKFALKLELERIFVCNFIDFLTRKYGAPQDHTYKSWPEELLDITNTKIQIKEAYDLNFKDNVPDLLRVLLQKPSIFNKSNLMPTRMTEYLTSILRDKKVKTEPLTCLHEWGLVNKCSEALNRETNKAKTLVLYDDICGKESGILVFLSRIFQRPEEATGETTVSVTVSAFIGGDKFNAIWKNEIRDNYTLGFLSLKERIGKKKGRTTLENHWRQLRELLGQEWEFSQNSGERYILLREFDHNLSVNPLDVAFFSHLSSLFPEYLVILLALDSEAELDVNEIINKFPEDIMSYGSDRNKVRRYATTLEDLGCIHIQKLKKTGTRGKMAEKMYFKKSTLTMQALLDDIKGPSAEGSDNGAADLCVCLSDLFMFFSQYYILGEVGTILRRRLDYALSSREDLSNSSPFSYRQNYIQRSIYDYNLYDLLYAAENQCVCLIIYSPEYSEEKKGTKDLQNYLVTPLEIRISAVNGREYVLCYDLLSKSLVSCRIEYIESIKIYPNDLDGFEVIIEGPQESKTKTIETDALSRKLKTAENMLPYIWGVELSHSRVSDSWRKNLRNIEIITDFSDISQLSPVMLTGNSHLINIKQNSNGNVTLSVTCFPTKELRPWIRKLYPHVLSINDNMFTDTRYIFDVSKDVAALHELYELNLDDPIFLSVSAISHADQRRNNTLKLYKKSSSPNGTKKKIEPLESEGHFHLFNELFSNQNIGIASNVLKASQHNACPDTVQNAIEKLKEFPLRKPRSDGYLDQNQITAADLFFDEGNHPKFSPEEDDYLYQLLPLTKIECRWLLTVMDDPLASMFLSEETISKIKYFIKNNTPMAALPLRMNLIYYFDQYNRTEIDKNEGDFASSKDPNRSMGRIMQLKTLYSSIRSGDFLDVVYYSNGTANSKIQNQEKKIVTISFGSGYGRKLPDRILTEFSLWKKTCIYDEKADLFEMKLHYPAEDEEDIDEEDIIDRILSYGPHVKVMDSSGNSTIYRKIRDRIDRQKEILDDPQNQQALMTTKGSARKTEHQRLLPKQLVYSRMYNAFSLTASAGNGRPDIELPLDDIIELKPSE